MAELEIVTDATVAQSASLNIVVEEDADGDGTFENSATVSVSDGTNTQTVSGIDGASGNDVRVTSQFSTSDVTVGASLNSVGVSIVLQPPKNVSTSVSGNDVTVSWDAAEGANGYNILRAPSSGGNFSQIASVGSNTTSFTDTGLQFNEDYAYKIESFN